MKVTTVGSGLARNDHQWSRWASTMPTTTTRLTDTAIMAHDDESPRRYLQPHSDGPSEVTEHWATTMDKGKRAKEQYHGRQ